MKKSSQIRSLCQCLEVRLYDELHFKEKPASDVVEIATQLHAILGEELAIEQPTLNGLAIYDGPDGTTRFIPLPRELWRPTGGNCHCPHCKGAPGYWDTLAIGAGCAYTWTVHMPERHRGVR